MPRVDRTNPDAEVLTGFPAHGESVSESAPPADPPAAADPPAPAKDPIMSILEELRGEIAHIKRSQPLAQPKEPAISATPKEQEIDWDKEFYTSPKAALERHAEIVERRVTQQLEGRYQRDRSTQAFWDQFYDKHKDLKQDHDLVDLTLKSNLAEMSSMPVPQAMDRLAELTRDRILRYAGGKRAPKAKVEGAGGAPSAPKPVQADDQVLSITDLIRQRRDRRRKAAGA